MFNLKSIATASCFMVPAGLLATHVLAAEASAAASSDFGGFTAHVVSAPILKPVLVLASRSVTSTADVGNFSMSDRERSVRSEIGQYAALQPGWDGYDSDAPSQAALSDMVAFLDALPPGIAIPRVTLAATGVPSFYWDERDFFADLEFVGGGECSLYARAKLNEGEKILREYQDPLAAASDLILELNSISA